MLTKQISGSVAIEPGGTLHFINRGRRRLSFKASSGFLWLTRDGDIKDYVLQAGDGVTLCAGDDVWLTLEKADGAASLAFEPLEAPHPLRDAVVRLFTFRPAQPCPEGRLS